MFSCVQSNADIAQNSQHHISVVRNLSSPSAPQRITNKLQKARCVGDPRSRTKKLCCVTTSIDCHVELPEEVTKNGSSNFQY